jgi:hypothetical protein
MMKDRYFKVRVTRTLSDDADVFVQVPPSDDVGSAARQAAAQLDDSLFTPGNADYDDGVSDAERLTKAEYEGGLERQAHQLAMDDFYNYNGQVRRFFEKSGIDWEALREQKKWLATYVSVGHDEARGLSDFIEKMQKDAVEAGMHEGDVFGDDGWPAPGAS